MTTSKRKATASLSSGNLREDKAARAGIGRLRENAVPRHRQATCPLSITVCSQNMCRTCFRARENAHYTSSLMFLASASFVLRKSTCAKLAKFVVVEHTGILPGSSFGDVIQLHHVFFTFCRLASIFPKKNDPPQTTFECLCFFVYFCTFAFFLCSNIFSSNLVFSYIVQRSDNRQKTRCSRTRATMFTAQIHCGSLALTLWAPSKTRNRPLLGPSYRSGWDFWDGGFWGQKNMKFWKYENHVKKQCIERITQQATLIAKQRAKCQQHERRLQMLWWRVSGGRGTQVA